MRKTLSDILRIKGYIATGAATGKAALTWVQEETPAVALIDLRLEDMSGLEVMRGIKEVSPRTECIVLTGYASQSSAIEAVNLGAYSYLQKPYDVEQLLVTIRRAVEKRAAEEALRESEEKFRLTFENAEDAIFWADVETGFITNCNKAAEILLEKRREEIIGQHQTALHPPENAEHYGRMFRRFTERKGADDEAEVITKSGRIIPVHITASATLVGGKSIIQGIFRDITDRKQAEKERAQLEAQLRQVQKMEAVGRLAGGVAHDFNNLLTVILGNLGLAERAAPETMSKYLISSRAAAERAANLVQQLLAFSRKSLIELKPVNLNRIIDEVYHFARETIDRRIEILVQTEEGLPNVRADAAQINLAIVNLCINARDAINDVMQGRVTPERRADRFVITLKTETTVVGPQYCETHAYGWPGRFVVLTVSDNGAGMDEETQPHIFEPFFTTKEVGKGTGLGLASAYGIVKQHNGWIDLQSERGTGTTLRVYLPVTEEEAQKEEPARYEEPRAGTETVLLVDDEEMIRSLGERILQSHGYTVLLAADGKEGLDLYLKERRRISLIILDLSMPYLSGYEMLEEVHRLTPDAKVIVSSGYSQKGYADSLDRLGVAAYVAKPYRPADLARAVREVLDR